MLHMPSLEIWEWGFKIFDGAPTLTTHVNHLLLSTEHNKHSKHRAQTLVKASVHIPPFFHRENS